MLCYFLLHMTQQSHSWAYIYLEETIIPKDVCTPIFTATLITTARSFCFSSCFSPDHHCLGPISWNCHFLWQFGVIGWGTSFSLNPISCPNTPTFAFLGLILSQPRCSPPSISSFKSWSWATYVYFTWHPEQQRALSFSFVILVLRVPLGFSLQGAAGLLP